MVRPHLLAARVVPQRHCRSNEATELGSLLGPIITTSYYIFILHLPIAPSYYTSSYILHLSITSSYCIFLLHRPIAASGPRCSLALALAASSQPACCVQGITKHCSGSKLAAGPASCFKAVRQLRASCFSATYLERSWRMHELDGLRDPFI